MLSEKFVVPNPEAVVKRAFMLIKKQKPQNDDVAMSD